MGILQMHFSLTACFSRVTGHCWGSRTALAVCVWNWKQLQGFRLPSRVPTPLKRGVSERSFGAGMLFGNSGSKSQIANLKSQIESFITQGLDGIDLGCSTRRQPASKQSHGQQ